MIAHNANTLDLHCILNRAVLMKWQVELIIKRFKNHVHASGESSLTRQRFILTLRTI